MVKIRVQNSGRVQEAEQNNTNGRDGIQFSHSGTFAGVPGSRGYFFGVRQLFKQTTAVR